MGAANKALFCSNMCNRIFVIYSTSCFTTCELQTFIIFRSGFRYQSIVHSQYSVSMDIFSHLVRTSLIFKSGHKHISLGTDTNRKIIKNKFSLILEETFSVFQYHRLSSSYGTISFQLISPSMKVLGNSYTSEQGLQHTSVGKRACSTHMEESFFAFTHSYISSSTNRKFQRRRDKIFPHSGINISPYSSISKLIYELVMPKVGFIFLLSPLHIRIIFNIGVSDIIQLLQMWKIKQVSILHPGNLKIGQSTKMLWQAVHACVGSGRPTLYFLLYFLLETLPFVHSQYCFRGDFNMLKMSLQQMLSPLFNYFHWISKHS